MTTASETSPIFVWDGQRHLAFAMGGGDAILALFAHGGASPSLVAVWEASAGPCIAALPAGCRHGELQIQRGGLVAETIAIELDDLLLPDLIAADLDGVRRVRFERRADGVSLDAPEAADGPAAGLGCLNLVIAGVPSFSRCRVGPLFDPRDGGRRIGVEAADGPKGSVVLSLGPGPAASMLLAAHVVGRARALRQQIDLAGEMPPALAEAFADLATGFPAGADASGAAAAEALRRGFRLLAPAGGRDGASLAVASWSPDDELIVFAPRGFQAVWRGEGGGAPGSRLFLSRADGGPWAARVVSTAYRPATSTAMAALGGGVAQHQGGKAATSEADLAADLASAIWQRERGEAASGPPSALALAAEGQGAGKLPPLARLTLASLSAPRDGVSPVIAAFGAAFGIAPQVLEEIDALPVGERLALVLWFARDEKLASRAVQARVILPFPQAAQTVDRVAAALVWYTDLDLPDRLQRAAARLAGQSATPERLDAIRVLRQIADAAGDHWIELASIVAAETVLAANPEPEIAGADGPVRQLVARLRQNSEAAAAAQAEGRGLDLAQLAEWRTGLSAAASESGQSEAFGQDLARRLQELSATDILLLRQHFHSAVSRQQAVAAIRDAVTALDDAAGNDRLAQRMDRGGDALIGMTRLGSASEAAVRELTRLPPARNALVSLNNWINGRVLQADPQDALIGQLRRNLQSYGCLLLLQAVTEECDAAFPKDADAGPSAEAWRERLRSGIVETLPHYARAAAAFQAEDATLGDTLIARLTGAARP